MPKPTGPKIPRGWRKLRAGTVRKEGDLHWDVSLSEYDDVSSIGTVITEEDTHDCGPYIRRVRKWRGK